jgi:hypothetical protein
MSFSGNRFVHPDTGGPVNAVGQRGGRDSEEHIGTAVPSKSGCWSVIVSKGGKHIQAYLCP